MLSSTEPRNYLSLLLTSLVKVQLRKIKFFFKIKLLLLEPKEPLKSRQFSSLKKKKR